VRVRGKEGRKKRSAICAVTEQTEQTGQTGQTEGDGALDVCVNSYVHAHVSVHLLVLVLVRMHAYMCACQRVLSFHVCAAFVLELKTCE